jgi:hypothetical protein
MISRQQRALWQAVSSAEFAVLAAQQAGAPAAELDALCRRLRLAAEDADRHVPSPRNAPLPRQPPPGISDLLIASEMIQDAAATVITSLSDAGELSEPSDDSRAEGIRRHCEAAAARIDCAAKATAGFRDCRRPAAGAEPPHDEPPCLSSRV